MSLLSQEPQIGNSGKQPVRSSTLRFQRRTSERAFIEGSYRDNSGQSTLSPRGMEYPGSGTSPWASSPDASRTSFGGDIPREDLPPSIMAQNGEEPQVHRQTGNGSTTHDTPSNWSPEQQHQWQQNQQGQAGAVEENRRPHSQARYHGAPPPPVHQPQGGAAGGPTQHHQHSQQPQRPAAHYKIQAKITSMERPNKKDPILRFDVYTNLPKFRTTQFRDIRRTHSEFQKLGSYLQASNPEALVPAVPPPSTAYGLGTDEDEARTKANLQRWLNSVCSNEVLMRDEEMIFFVESDFGYSPVVRKKQPATGVRRKMLKQFAPPPDDTPELLESRPIVKGFYLGSMDAGQKVDKIVKNRRSLGVAETDLGAKLAQMATQESHPGLAHAYKKLGRVVQVTGDYHSAQGTAEAATLSDPLAYHSSDAFIVKETLTNRHILLREFIQAQQASRAKMQAADRLKTSSSVKHDKVNDAIAALDEARSHESYLQQKTQRVTQNLLVEKRKWFARTSADMRASIREYVIKQIEAERRQLATMEQVRPDVRNIDASGGLSRLGREAHPIVRRSSMASSQGPKGDAWSGVPRRPDGLNRSISGSFAGGPGVPEEQEEEGDEGKATGRPRASTASSLAKVDEEDDGDRVDAKNAASRLAQTTF